MEVLMALVDFIPVTLCFIAMVELQKCLYNHMSKYMFALLASGSIMILTAGLLKALWKLLYYGFNLDMYRLNYLFFPIQAIGFVLAFLGILFMLVIPNKKGVTPVCSIFFSSIVAEEGKQIINDTMLYVVLQILGCGGIYACIAYMAKKMNKKLVILWMSIAFICMLLMGFLSTRISRATGNDYLLYNWMAEGVNILGQGMLLLSVIQLEKAGLKNFSFQK